jgi:hypothetical protein
MSEVLTYNKVELGKTEEYFLSMFLYGKFSAYDVFRDLKIQTELEEPRVVNAMAYKNVHKRIRRLQTLKLIKELNKKFSRKAKKYTLTNKGLFQLMLSKYAFNVAFYLSSSYINIKGYLINTILFQFFEEETIKEFFTYFRQMELAEYLRNCCEAIQKKVDQLTSSYTGFNNQIFSTELEDLIKNEARNFIFKIVVDREKNYERLSKIKQESSDPSIRYLYPEIDGQDPNYNSLLPKAALNNDKKFLRILKEMKDELDKGCEDYLVSLEMMD